MLNSERSWDSRRTSFWSSVLLMHRAATYPREWTSVLFTVLWPFFFLDPLRSCLNNSTIVAVFVVTSTHSVVFATLLSLVSELWRCSTASQSSVREEVFGVVRARISKLLCYHYRSNCQFKTVLLSDFSVNIMPSLFSDSSHIWSMTSTATVFRSTLTNSSKFDELVHCMVSISLSFSFNSLQYRHVCGGFGRNIINYPALHSQMYKYITAINNNKSISISITTICQY